MRLLVFLLLCATALTATEITDSKHEPATSYSIIYRFDTPETSKPISTPVITKTEAEPIAYEKAPIVYENTYIASEPTRESMQIIQEDKNKVNAEPDKTYANTETKESQSTVKDVIIHVQNIQSESNSAALTDKIVTTTVYPKIAPYSDFLSGPLIQEGRLLTPGLSAYASSSKEVEPIETSISYSEEPAPYKSSPNKEVKNEPAKTSNADSQEPATSHTSFKGPDVNYSW